MYVLVLGLDVLGNPFALITGLKEGAKDFFYEPYQVRSALDYSASISVFMLSIKKAGGQPWEKNINKDK